MSLREREQLLSAENQQSVANTSTPPDGHGPASYTMDVDTMFPPPGEEGFSFSHGEKRYHCMRNWRKSQLKAQGSCLDLRDRSGRVAQQLADWSTQYNDLTDALLHYHHRDHQTTAPSPAIDSSFSIKVIDIFDAQYPHF
ncbi:hypothetical protein DFJ58DRAFT_731531 [Suillus subalutaceus]|uniref:uncharacterized protein n=1 Tax=Suillus subalutaceus TaxID=48586 RepID=UPI001B87773F|nr:uncharacterized protein DFJ58DRAFT_731531 [Suillus subalutaceus]KAG1843584.1 hypothetical protein DFJ58DRAFT_731531 [Suillus subalutaceus]